MGASLYWVSLSELVLLGERSWSELDFAGAFLAFTAAAGPVVDVFVISMPPPTIRHRFLLVAPQFLFCTFFLPNRKEEEPDPAL